MSSRQEAYQLRKLRDGLCRQCGRKQLKSATMCDDCRIKMKIRFARNLERQRRKGKK